MIRAAALAGAPRDSHSSDTIASIAVRFRITTSIVSCSRTSHRSPKSKPTPSPNTALSASAASSPSPHATGPPLPRNTSYATRNPRISHLSSNATGAAAPSTSHATTASYASHGLNGVKRKRTTRLPPGGISSSLQSHS